MRFNINLASQPYEAARFYRRRMGALVVALAVLTVLLVGYIVYQRSQSRGINRQIAEVRREINGLNSEEAQARALLNKPANRDIAAPTHDSAWSGLSSTGSTRGRMGLLRPCPRGSIRA